MDWIGLANTCFLALWLGVLSVELLFQAKSGVCAFWNANMDNIIPRNMDTVMKSKLVGDYHFTFMC